MSEVVSREANSFARAGSPAGYVGSLVCVIHVALTQKKNSTERKYEQKFSAMFNGNLWEPLTK